MDQIKLEILAQIHTVAPMQTYGKSSSAEKKWWGIKFKYTRKENFLTKAD